MTRLSAALLATALAWPAAAQDRTEAEIKQLALQAILENPEIVMEAVGILQERQAAEEAAAARAALAETRDELLDASDAPVLGNPEGDVTVVEFFDYNCPYCRRAGPEVQALLARDPEVRVIYREWPILGDGSVYAARAALAAREQDRYEAFHEALMGAGGRLDEAAVTQIAAEVGLDLDRLAADMEAPAVQAHIDKSMQLAQALGINGTPAFVIGDEVVAGLVPADDLAGLVEAAREGDR